MLLLNDTLLNRGRGKTWYPLTNPPSRISVSISVRLNRLCLLGSVSRKASTLPDVGLVLLVDGCEVSSLSWCSVSSQSGSVSVHAGSWLFKTPPYCTTGLLSTLSTWSYKLIFGFTANSKRSKLASTFSTGSYKLIFGFSANSKWSKLVGDCEDSRLNKYCSKESGSIKSSSGSKLSISISSGDSSVSSSAQKLFDPSILDFRPKHEILQNHRV